MTGTISATTRVVAVLGSPVRHSLSPILHGAGFAAAGLDWVCVALEVDEAAGPAALFGAGALGFGGLSVTMPLKAVAAEVCHELSPAAARLRSVNCVVIGDDGSLHGHSTDGAGLLDALRLDEGIEIAGRSVTVLGAGGAARAVVAAVAGAGADEVVVVNRTAERAEAAAELAGPVGRVGGPDDVAAADVVINATSVGMGDTGALPCDPALLHDGQVAVDLVYHPVDTAWLVAARRHGARSVDGVGMLVHQAAHAFRLWTGVEAPVAAMQAAARARLG